MWEQPILTYLTFAVPSLNLYIVFLFCFSSARQSTTSQMWPASVTGSQGLAV